MKYTKYKIPNTKYQNRGQALVLTVFLLSVIIAIGLAISNIFVVEIRLAGDVTESAKAVMAADAGLEWALFNERIDDFSYFNDISCSWGSRCLLANGAYFEVRKTQIGNRTELISIGNFRNTKRGLRVSY